MADQTVAQAPGSWRTDPEVRDEHDRLATIYRQRGLSVLIETAADEMVKLRRAHGMAVDLIRWLVEDGVLPEFWRHFVHDLPTEARCVWYPAEYARALLARL